jgi:diacylglycerol kinase (ATP)
MPAGRFVVVVNPRGGKRQGLPVLERVRPILAAGAELDVRVTERSEHAGEIAHALDLHGYDGICVIGGDGTVHEVADGLMRRGVPVSIPLGIIPAGTGNTLHQQIGCGDPLEAARRIAAGNTQPLDIARVAMNGRVVYCANIIGWGAVADINSTAESLRMLGPPRYALAALWHIARYRRRPIRLVLDGGVSDDEFLFVIACNTKFTGSGMKLAPHAEIGDGKIDVVVVRRASRRELLKLFSRVFDGSHLSLGCVEYHQVRSFAIESECCEQLNLDGEMKGNAPVSAEVLPGALRVFG